MKNICLDLGSTGISKERKRVSEEPMFWPWQLENKYPWPAQYRILGFIGILIVDVIQMKETIEKSLEIYLWETVVLYIYTPCNIQNYFGQKNRREGV